MTQDGLEGKTDKTPVVSDETLAEIRRKILALPTRTEEEIQAEFEKLHGTQDPSKFVVEEGFTVDKVVVQNYQQMVSPMGEQVFGGQSGRYAAGYTQVTTLTVKPDTQIPITTLQFHGMSIVEAGDYIRAKIPKCEGNSSWGDTRYKPRDLKQEESAIEITILHEGKIVRTERAVDYQHYTTQQT